MCRNLLFALPALWLQIGFLISPGGLSGAADAEIAAAESEVKRLGGSVRYKGQQMEVDFHLRGRGLTDDGLAHLARLKNITWLNLKDTKITGAGLAHLQGLDKLRWLHLEQTQVGDAGMQHLAGLPNLEYLNLYATNITDNALAQLAQCKHLRRLYVWQTRVTDLGVARLQKKLPKLKIVRGLDLSKLSARDPTEAEKPKPKVSLKWEVVSSRAEAPPRSENGINCQILFENKSARPVKLYWISYGNGELKLYATLPPGATRQQNSYVRNVWLVTDKSDQ
ncbi:MAG: hypothetical protein ABGZ17_06980, partial [Planctomycetaceae bacterium]